MPHAFIVTGKRSNVNEMYCANLCGYAIIVVVIDYQAYGGGKGCIH